jgi:hypothetical protein
MLRLTVALPEARSSGAEHAAEGNVDHGFSLMDDKITDWTRPIKRIPEKSPPKQVPPGSDRLALPLSDAASKSDNKELGPSSSTPPRE